MFDLFSLIILHLFTSFFFFFNDTATTEIYTLSLHDALPICNQDCGAPSTPLRHRRAMASSVIPSSRSRDRKSTRLNSSHLVISYAVFCLKKKKKKKIQRSDNHSKYLTSYVRRESLLRVLRCG